MTPTKYDEQAAQREADERTSLSTSIYWLKAVIEQGGRVFEAAAQPTAHSNSELYNSRAKLEEQFFQTACEKAQRWIDPMKLKTPEAIHFSELGETIKNVRDEREHDDERYGLGNKFDTGEVDAHEHAKRGFLLKRPKPGKNSNPWPNFWMKKADTDGGATIVTSMSGTVLSGGRMLLGGIVDVAKVVRAAEALIEPLLETQHAYWDQRFASLSGSNEKRAIIAESYYIEPRF